MPCVFLAILFFVVAMLRNSRANVLPDVPSGSIEYKDL